MTYRVLIGLDYLDAKGARHRAEPGDVVDNLPKRSVGWLLEDHAIEPVAADATDKEDDDGG